MTVLSAHCSRGNSKSVLSFRKTKGSWYFVLAVFVTSPFSSIPLFSKPSHCGAPFWIQVARIKWKVWFFFPCYASENRENVQEVLWIAWWVMTRSQHLQHSLRTILKWLLYFGGSKMYKNNPLKKNNRMCNNRMCKKWTSGAGLPFCWTIWAVTNYHCQSCHAGVMHSVATMQARGVGWLKRGGNSWHRGTHLCFSKSSTWWNQLFYLRIYSPFLCARWQ